MHDWELHRAMADKGWIAQALPEALGGGGRGPEELALLFRELELAGAPYDGLSICTMLASVIAHVGNDMQRREVLPKLLAGEALIALGYTEPDSGSDVAAARTRAVRDGDGWRIDGQKIFTSLAEESEWVFLLTRTDPDVPKHAGPHVLPRADRRRPASSSSPSAPCRASARTSRSTTVCTSTTSGASVR